MKSTSPLALTPVPTEPVPTSPVPTAGPALRRLRPEDAPDVLAAFNSDSEMARQGTVRNLGEATSYVQTLVDDPNAEPWVVVVDGVVAGLVLIHVDQGNLNGWVSYWMNSNARGRGLTARAAATVADWALTMRGLERLELGHRVNNPSSGAIALRAGFVHEGTERAKFLIHGERIDVLTYGRLTTDAAPSYEPLPFLES